MATEKQFGDLSQFAKRDVELFRSSDLHNTAIYFTEKVDDEDRKDAKAFFELLRFELKGGDHQIYIRFPNENHFIEMIGAGFGSSHGEMMIASGRNIWNDAYDAPIKIFSTENNLLLVMGGGGLPKFNFMEKVASYDKGNPFNRPYPNETFLNLKEIEKALALKYLKITESIRKIQYCYKTKDETPKYFLVDCPAYNFQYTNHRFFVIENESVKEFVIKNFVRYSDGGTTIITVTDENGTEHKFFSPTSLPEKTLCEKWDETELIEATETEKQKLVDLMKLDLEPVSTDEQ